MRPRFAGGAFFAEVLQILMKNGILLVVLTMPDKEAPDP